MRNFMFLALAAGLAGCAPPPLDAPPAVEARAVTLKSGETVVPVQDGNAANAARDDQRGVQLSQVRYGIPRGAEIGNIDAFGCIDLKTRGRLYHNGASGPDHQGEWQKTFAKVMIGHGHRVPRDPDAMFTTAKQQGADLLVGANITEVHLDARVSCNFVSNRSEGMRAQTTMTVDWQIFDPARREVVLRLSGNGRYESDQLLAVDAGVPLQLAFADAVNNLAADPQLRALLQQAASATAGPAPKIRQPLPRLPLSQQPIAEISEAVRNATVLIEVGNGGHGSGFLVSASGFMVTNAHVVGSQRFVRVRLLSGRAVIGEVLQTDERRDVALVKLEGDGYPALPVREAPVRVAEEVYAVGAPRMEELAWTVTRGVVSAYRQAMPPEKLDYIQADVPVHGGNSGGPLLDRNGNLVGICVLGLGMDAGKRNASLNLFIPILDGLDRLGLDLQGPAAPAGRQSAAVPR